MTAETIHLVEDDKDVSEALSTLIKSLHYQVREYGNAIEFIDTYQANHPECLLLDIRMPKMSGLELQQYLIDKSIQIPVIFISGHADIDMAVGCIQAGAVDFITKPIKQQRLIDAVNKALRQDKIQLEENHNKSVIQERLNRLSKRENEILVCMIQGKMPKAISAELGISPNTVDNHKANILSKMHAKTASTLIFQLCECDLINTIV